MSSSPTARRLVVAVTGASGALYSIRFLRAVLDCGVDVELILSDYGKRLLIEECDLNPKTDAIDDWIEARYGKLGNRGKLNLNSQSDLGAGIASGSQSWDAMVIIPCSMKTLSSVAHGTSANLIERCADVTLKEGRELVLVPRETPLNLIQLENLTKAARAGARIVPAMPAFYYKPQSFEDLADFIAGRVLSLLKIPHRLFDPWKE